MIQHIWTVLCRVTITGQETNNVSLIEVLEEVIVASSPAKVTTRTVPAIFDIVSLWTKDDHKSPENGLAVVQVLDPNGQKLMEFDIDVDLTKSKRLRTFLRLFGFSGNGPGVHHFVVSLKQGDNETVVATIPLEVRVEEQPQTNEGSTEIPTEVADG